MTTKGDGSRGTGKSPRWRHPANRRLDRRHRGERIADRVHRPDCPCVRQVAAVADDLLTALSRDL